MMEYGHCPDKHHGQHPMGQAQPIICPPQFRVHDSFMPRELPIIHPIVNVNRLNTVDVPRHFFPETTENVMGAHFGPGRGPGVGPAGMGPAGMGPAGMGPAGFGPAGFGPGRCPGPCNCCPRGFGRHRRGFF